MPQLLLPATKLLVVVMLASLLFTTSSGWAQSIAYQPALIPSGGSPVPVLLAISPANPTTNDVIRFTAPLDSELYGNACYAAGDLGGDPILLFDSQTRTIDIGFDGDIPEQCPAVYDPVTGAFGELGKLAAGNWVLNNSEGFGLFFTVAAAPVPEPSTLLLLVGMVLLGRHTWREVRLRSSSKL